MRSPESYEKEDIDDFITELGAYNCKPTTGGYGKSGTPDRIVCYKGRFIGIEVKREGKNGKIVEPTALQYKRMCEIEEAGGQCFWGTAEKVIGEMKAWLASL